MNDWSHHLQMIVSLEKHAHEALNRKNWADAYERLLEIEFNSREARNWILKEITEKK